MTMNIEPKLSDVSRFIFLEFIVDDVVLQRFAPISVDLNEDENGLKNPEQVVFHFNPILTDIKH